MLYLSCRISACDRPHRPVVSLDYHAKHAPHATGALLVSPHIHTVFSKLLSDHAQVHHPSVSVVGHTPLYIFSSMPYRIIQQCLLFSRWCGNQKQRNVFSPIFQSLAILRHTCYHCHHLLSAILGQVPGYRHTHGLSHHQYPALCLSLHSPATAPSYAIHRQTHTLHLSALSRLHRSFQAISVFVHCARQYGHSILDGIAGYYHCRQSSDNGSAKAYR